jgi:hypothetical protein
MSKPNAPPARKSALPPGHRRLVNLMQSLNFGRITVLIRHGEADFGRPWRMRRTVKLAGGENGARPEAASVDVELCKEQTTLLAALKQVDDGARVTIEVKHGLPFLLEIEQEHQAA